MSRGLYSAPPVARRAGTELEIAACCPRVVLSGSAARSSQGTDNIGLQDHSFGIHLPLAASSENSSSSANRLLRLVLAESSFIGGEQIRNGILPSQLLLDSSCARTRPSALSPPDGPAAIGSFRQNRLLGLRSLYNEASWALKRPSFPHRIVRWVCSRPCIP